jgi:nucleoside-diphosphate-sugar epimerase
VLDNVYMLGRPGNRPLDEDTPPNPCSRKGEIRACAAERLFEAHRRGDVLATAGRASDYYGPGGTLTHLGDQFWRPALRGKTARVLVNPDTIHTYHYIPDVAAGLLTLGCAESDVHGRPWMLPCAPAGTMRELVARFSRKLGREIKLSGVPRWMVKAIGVFVPVVREVDEMLYQWDEPSAVSRKVSAGAGGCGRGSERDRGMGSAALLLNICGSNSQDETLPNLAGPPLAGYAAAGKGTEDESESPQIRRD